MRTIKHIPKPAHPIFALIPADTLDKAVSNPTMTMRERTCVILVSSISVYQIDHRSDKRRNLSSIRIRRFKGGSIDSECSQSSSSSFLKKSSKATQAAAVSSKLEDGNISAAVRDLCSDDSPAVFSTDDIEKFKHKHPQEHNEIRVPPSPRHAGSAGL